MSTPELLLHVGFQQTGAGMLRRALGRIRPQLHHHGIGLIPHGALAGLPSAAGWRTRTGAVPQEAAAFERDVVELIDRESAAIRRTGAEPRVMVISSDHLLGRENLDGRDEQLLRPAAEEAVGQMLRVADPDRARVVVYLRRQDRLMEACYLRSLQQGATHRFEQQFERRFEPVLDYGALIERLRDLAPSQAVRVRPFELVGTSAVAYVADLLALLGLDGQLDLTRVGDDLRPYRLYSSRAARMALEVNAHLDSSDERRLIREFLLEHFAASDDAGTRLLAPEDRGKILEAYAPANQRLYASYLPDLPVESYASDEATDRLVAMGVARTASPEGVGERRAPMRGRSLLAAAAAWTRGTRGRGRSRADRRPGAERGRA